jgi:hypothetical protein
MSIHARKRETMPKVVDHHATDTTRAAISGETADTSEGLPA